MNDWAIRRDDLSHPAVLALLELHLRAAHENSPPGSVFALDASGLRDPAVCVWTLWEGDALLGMAALKQLDPTHAEVKSMRTAPGQLRRGVAGALLDHLIAQARGQGFRRLSLETGSNEPFVAAHALYRRAGFVDCPPFGAYADTVFAQYFTKPL